jgi:hypothetical protein
MGCAPGPLGAVSPGPFEEVGDIRRSLNALQSGDVERRVPLGCRASSLEGELVAGDARGDAEHCALH